MSDCKGCEFNDGFTNLVCSGCKVFHKAIDKTAAIREYFSSQPSQNALDHFKKLWEGK